MAKKILPRCKNCGDETRFPANSTGPREKLGWCVPCYRQAERMSSGGPSEAHSGVWKPPAADEYREPRGLYGRTPYDSRGGSSG